MKGTMETGAGVQEMTKCLTFQNLGGKSCNEPQQEEARQLSN